MEAISDGVSLFLDYVCQYIVKSLTHIFYLFHVCALYMHLMENEKLQKHRIYPYQEKQYICCIPSKLFTAKLSAI